MSYPKPLPAGAVYLGMGCSFLTPAEGFAGWCSDGDVPSSWVFVAYLMGDGEDRHYAAPIGSKIANSNVPIVAVVSEPALPSYAGMSLRDWFAGQALAGILPDPDLVESTTSTAETCYHYADAMMKARGGAA